MGEERKKAIAKPIPVLEVKKRNPIEAKKDVVVEDIKIEPKVVEKKKPIVKPKIIEVVEENKPDIIEPKKEVSKEKKGTTKFTYVRIALSASREERRAISERMQRGELVLSHCSIDGDEIYHYYVEFK